MASIPLSTVDALRAITAMGPMMCRPWRPDRRNPKSGQVSSSAVASRMRISDAKGMNVSSSSSAPVGMPKRSRKTAGSAPSSRTSPG